MKEVKIAIAGLGRVGSLFLKKMIEQKGKDTKIVGVVEERSDTPGIRVAQKENIKIYPTVQGLLLLGDSVDVIFDLTGSKEVRKTLRSGMAETNNRHTVVAPEIIALLIWDLITSGEVFPENHSTLQGY